MQKIHDVNFFKKKKSKNVQFLFVTSYNKLNFLTPQEANFWKK